VPHDESRALTVLFSGSDRARSFRSFASSATTSMAVFTRASLRWKHNFACVGSTSSVEFLLKAYRKYSSRVQVHDAQSLRVRSLLHGLASAETLRDPTRADLVALLSEMSSKTAIERLHCRMSSCAEGRRLLKERRRVSKQTLEFARLCDPDSFGFKYAEFMDRRQFKPEDRPTLSSCDTSLDASQKYVLIRLREVHDFLHVLFDCSTTIEGELTLKAIEFVNCQLPVSGLAALIGKLQVSNKSQERLRRYLFPWATRAGAACAPIECTDFESSFHLNLNEVRRRLRIQSYLA
jgi:ubiquinone biosynthesis protein COQ4